MPCRLLPGHSPGGCGFGLLRQLELFRAFGQIALLLAQLARSTSASASSSPRSPLLACTDELQYYSTTAPPRAPEKGSSATRGPRWMTPRLPSRCPTRARRQLAHQEGGGGEGGRGTGVLGVPQRRASPRPSGVSRPRVKFILKVVMRQTALTTHALGRPNTPVQLHVLVPLLKKGQPSRRSLPRT